MPVAADYPFLDIFWTTVVVVGWAIWFWMLITVLMDLFRRKDISGWGKAAWTLFVIVLPFLGVLVYLIAQGRQMAERRAEEARASAESFDRYVRDVATNGGPTDEIAKAKRLLDSGAIDQTEFARLKTRALA